MAVKRAGSEIIVERGGIKRFGTDAPPVNLLLSSQITPTVGVNFPEFSKDWVYGYSRENVVVPDFPPVTFYVGYAVIISKILPVEWSASEVIGAVPAGCNYIDVRAVLSWTKQPSPSAGSPVRSPLNIGGQVHLQGGSAVLEIGNGFRRAIHVGLDGSDIVLTRYQSARNQQPMSYSAWGSPTQTGWSYLSSPNGTLQNVIGRATRSSTSVAFVPPYRGGPQAASVTGADDHSSQWSMQSIITPGRVNSNI